jgi:hypothetical protein
VLTHVSILQANLLSHGCSQLSNLGVRQVFGGAPELGFSTYLPIQSKLFLGRKEIAPLAGLLYLICAWLFIHGLLIPGLNGNHRRPRHCQECTSIPVWPVRVSSLHTCHVSPGSQVQTVWGKHWKGPRMLPSKAREGEWEWNDCEAEVGTMRN